MKEFWKQLKKYPLVIIFAVFLAVYTVGDCFARAKKYDEYENRTLAQFPPFSWDELVTNVWTQKYETYVQDQFLLRHQWIVAKSVAESLLQRTENNGVVYGEDDYQFAKFTQLPVGTDTSTTQLDQNIGFLTRFANRHPGKVSVMVIPSAANILADKLPAGAPMLEENPVMDEMFARLDGVAQTIDVREALRAHADEYLFYRTDHHWTTQGAYVAYQAAAQQLGIAGAFDAENTPYVDLENFYGTNYNKSLKFDTVPDTLRYYQLDNVMTVKEYMPDGTEYSSVSGSMYDESKAAVRDKYALFLRGNNGYSTIEGDLNSPAGEEKRILVIKDSYANCFVPYLTADYDYVDVVDLRYWKYNVEKLIEMFEYDQILLLYNFQTFSTETTLFYLNAMVAE